MKRIPQARIVAKALRAVRTAAQDSLKGVNQAASQLMAKGDYASAMTLAERGSDIRQFQAQVEELQQRWRVVCGAGEQGKNEATTPLWSYYQPILQALVEAGGECRLAELEGLVERLMNGSLQPGDRDAMARGRERWRVMIRRARRPLMAEGWIEDRRGPIWRIADAGRRAAGQAGVTDPAARVQARSLRR